MPEFYTLANLLIKQSEEIGEKQPLVFGSGGGQISPLMHVALWRNQVINDLGRVSTKEDAQTDGQAG